MFVIFLVGVDFFKRPFYNLQIIFSVSGFTLKKQMLLMNGSSFLEGRSPITIGIDSTKLIGDGCCRQ